VTSSNDSLDPDVRALVARTNKFIDAVLVYVDQYDDGHISLDSLRGNITLLVDEHDSVTWDAGYQRGLTDAELDGDGATEYEVEFDADDPEEDDPDDWRK